MATPAPMFWTALTCGSRLKAPPSATAVWVTLVSATLPLAQASPEWTSAVPSEVLEARPKLPTTPTSRPPEEGAVCVDVGVVVGGLPTAALRPELAAARPMFRTLEPWRDDRTAAGALDVRGGVLRDVGLRVVADRGGVAGGDAGRAVGPVGGLAVVGGHADDGRVDVVADGLLEERALVAGVEAAVAVVGDVARRRRCRRCWRRPTPTLATKAFWSMITRPPRAPPAEPVADWTMLVSDLLPVADALPVLTVALPSELLVALPLLAAMPAAVLASCTRPASLSETLPAATLPPLLARATPLFRTLASWLMIRMPPSWPWAEPLAVWLIVVFDWLPIELALPVEMAAEPLLALAAVPVLDAGPRPLVPVCSPAAVFTEPLPMAMLPPVLETAAPTFETLACWLITWIVPRLPETVTVWVLFVPDWLPTAVASPECACARAVGDRAGVAQVVGVGGGRTQERDQRTSRERQGQVANEPSARRPVQVVTGGDGQQSPPGALSWGGPTDSDRGGGSVEDRRATGKQREAAM